MSLAIRLNKRVTIQQKATGQDSFGQPVTGWEDVVTDTPDHKIAAAIEDMKGRQYFAAQATQNSVQTKITIRYRAGITPAMRVVLDAEVYDIEAVLGQDRRWLELMCVKGLSNG